MTDAGTSVAGLVLAIPGIIDLCIKYGDFLKEKIELYRHMGEIQGLKSFVAELVEGEMHYILRFFNSIDDRLTGTFRDQLEKMFQILRNILERVKVLFTSSDVGALGKLGFSFRGAKKISKACEELEDWQMRFLRRAVVFLFFGSDSISKKRSATAAAAADRVVARIERIRKAMVEDLPEEITLRLDLEDIAHDAQWRKLADSSLWVLGDSTDGESLAEYLEYTNTSTTEMNAARLTVRDLAARLREANPLTMGILRCDGYAQEPLKNRFVLKFPYPTGKSKPRSLQSFLKDPQNQKGLLHSMTDRVNLAKKIASAVLYIHSCDFVHKNIRPDTIVVFEDAASDAGPYPLAVGEPYLVGYDGIRKANARTLMIAETDWQKKVYLHPQRHRMKKGDEFTTKHDVYSLGVVLLEIACWDTFTNPEGLGKYVWFDRKTRTSLLPAENLKTKFEELAQTRIPPTLGNKYLAVVKSCLTGLADDEEGGLLNDKDGIVMGTAYITQIMSKLEDISL